MIRSMTGFARVEQQHDFGRLSWEIRSVNHRYLEISLRVPEEFRALEPKLRERLGHSVGRGKIDGTLRFQPASSGRAGRLNLNRPLVDRLLELQVELRAAAKVDSPPSITDLMRWPGVVEEQLPDPGPLHQAALQLMNEAADELAAARQREGEATKLMLLERLEGVSEWTAKIRQWVPEIRAALRQRMVDRVGDLQQPLDPGRLEQEVAVLAQKIDVDEELDRLDAHVEETRHALERSDPVGRRLDFLMQEFNRESNTLSSKSVDVRTTQAAVELKVLIEQMREQVQNVE